MIMKPKHSTPLISVITVNYNQAEVTSCLLSSLEACSYTNLEIIVVDNGSVEDCRFLKLKFPHIQLIHNSKNLGFAGGNNVGLSIAKGSFVLFVNNDVEVQPDFLEALLLPFMEDETTCATSPKIKYYHSRDQIQYAGSHAVNPFTLKNKHIGTGEFDYGQYDQTRKTDYAHGACMLVSIETIRKIGFMDESYFLYYEEQDWCERMNRSGGSIYYVFNSVVLHKESISTGKNSPLKVFYLTRNRLLFARKNFNGFPFFISMLYFVCLTIPKNTLSKLRNRAHLRAFYSGIIWNLNHKTTFKS